MSIAVMTQEQMPEQQVQWGGLVFLFVVLALLGYLAWLINLWLEDEQQVPLQDIVLTGARQHIDDGELIARIRQTQAGSFFELNVEQVHQNLEDMPWVYSASIRKRWPNSLKIYLVEQVPAAHWNSDLLLNIYGESFDAYLSQSDLPQLFGPGGSEQTALQGFRAMQALLAETGLAIEEMQLSERYAWHVLLDNGIKLKLGRTEFIDRFQRFVDVYPLLLRENKRIDYVDLRYDTGLAVGWLEESESEQAVRVN